MISFGIDFVAGRKRVPSPATGKIAFVTLRFILHLASACRTADATLMHKACLAAVIQAKLWPAAGYRRQS
jgi:hypothetical protein